jgi:glycosyltransferase involved in cell wall biosynthesis
MPAFTILIPSWNNVAYLRACVDSILKNSTYKHQIIVHVNEGHDSTIAYLHQQKINYTYSATNIGVCKALNKAYSLATESYICYMNDDMYVLPDWDKNLYAGIEKLNTHLFYASATMIEPKGSNPCCIAPHNFGTSIDTFEEQHLLNTKLEKTDWNGSSWPPSLVHKSLWDAVNGYDEAYSPGLYSDPDFSRKLWEHGVRHFIGVGNSQVYHFQSKSLGRVKLNNGKKTFCKKWGCTPSYFYKKYLQLGTLYKGALPEAKVTFGNTIKAKWYSI